MIDIILNLYQIIGMIVLGLLAACALSRPLQQYYDSKFPPIYGEESLEQFMSGLLSDVPGCICTAVTILSIALFWPAVAVACAWPVSE